MFANVNAHIATLENLFLLVCVCNAGIYSELLDFCLLTTVSRVTLIQTVATNCKTDYFDVACISITQPLCQLTNISYFTSQTRDQSLWAEGQGQMKGKFYILSAHCTAMQKGQVLEPVSKTACLLNQNQISKLTMDSNSNETLCDVAAMEDEEYRAEDLLERHL